MSNTIKDFDDALAAAAPRPTGAVDEVLTKLPAAQRQKVEAALRDRAVPKRRIAKALTLMGYKVSEGAIGSWRDREQPV